MAKSPPIELPPRMMSRDELIVEMACQMVQLDMLEMEEQIPRSIGCVWVGCGASGARTGAKYFLSPSAVAERWRYFRVDLCEVDTRSTVTPS
jgi:hypothetical protein